MKHKNFLSFKYIEKFDCKEVLTINNLIHIVDNRIAKKKAIEYIEKADIVWISGGNMFKQIQYIMEVKNENINSKRK